MPKQNLERPDIPFARYRARQGAAVIWAKQMPAAFKIEVNKGLVDQRKAGAQAAIQYVQTLAGNAGDYLVILRPDSGERMVIPHDMFDKLFVEQVDNEGL